MENILLALFALGIILSAVLQINIIAALVWGLVLFFGYGLKKKNSVRAMLRFAWEGIYTSRNVLIMFLLVGMLTALWRACGSIAYIVYCATAFCAPSAMVLLTFLLCCLISFLTGTAFGSAATMGVICAAMAAGMGVPAPYVGGAVLSGVFYGDRCSPVSTSALLVTELTRTKLAQNLKTMFRTSLVPFAVACALYGLLGLSVTGGGAPETTRALFQTHYNLTALTLLPVVGMLALSLKQVNVKTTLAVSCALGAFVAVCTQHVSAGSLPQLCWAGFHPQDAELARMMGGGGIISMLQVFCIIAISSSYAGIFKGTDFLSGIQHAIHVLSQKATRFGATCLVAVAANAVACNQTLGIMLTHQLCQPNYDDGQAFARDLANSAVVIATWVPWSIASGVPLASIGAPTVSILFSFYMFLLPLWNFALQWRKK